MTPEQIRQVQQSFTLVEFIADDAGELFYSCLFDLNPTLEHLFSGDLREQGRKLMQMLGAVVKGLNNLEQLLPTVRALGERHAGYGVDDHDYYTVEQALLWTLSTALGPLFTSEARDAWTTAYDLISTTMRAAAAKAGVVAGRGRLIAPTYAGGDEPTQPDAIMSVR